MGCGKSKKDVSNITAPVDRHANSLSRGNKAEEKPVALAQTQHEPITENTIEAGHHKRQVQDPLEEVKARPVDKKEENVAQVKPPQWGAAAKKVNEDKKQEEIPQIKQPQWGAAAKKVKEDKKQENVPQVKQPQWGAAAKKVKEEKKEKVKQPQWGEAARRVKNDEIQEKKEEAKKPQWGEAARRMKKDEVEEKKEEVKKPQWGEAARRMKNDEVEEKKEEVKKPQWAQAAKNVKADREQQAATQNSQAPHPNDGKFEGENIEGEFNLKANEGDDGEALVASPIQHEEAKSADLKSHDLSVEEAKSEIINQQQNTPSFPEDQAKVESDALIEDLEGPTDQNLAQGRREENEEMKQVESAKGAVPQGGKIEEYKVVESGSFAENTVVQSKIFQSK